MGLWLVLILIPLPHLHLSLSFPLQKLAARNNLTTCNNITPLTLPFRFFSHSTSDTESTYSKTEQSSECVHRSSLCCSKTRSISTQSLVVFLISIWVLVAMIEVKVPILVDLVPPVWVLRILRDKQVDEMEMGANEDVAYRI